VLEFRTALTLTAETMGYIFESLYADVLGVWSEELDCNHLIGAAICGSPDEPNGTVPEAPTEFVVFSDGVEMLAGTRPAMTPSKMLQLLPPSPAT
jgi:hypothetical protein